MADQASLCSASTTVSRVSSMRNNPEKPWKPYPPKRSISLGKSDVIRSPSAYFSGAKSEQKAKDVKNNSLCQTFVSVIPIDVSRRKFQPTTSQPEKLEKTSEANAEKPNSNESFDSTLTRKSIFRDTSYSNLYGVNEHGFGVKKNLNLRGKTPSRDRWATITGSNLDPYLYEDDFVKKPQKHGSLKIENQTKTKSSASFLLCASQKSFKLTQKEENEKPFERLTPPSEWKIPIPTKTNRKPVAEVPNKKPKVTSIKTNKDIKSETQKLDHVTSSHSSVFGSKNSKKSIAADSDKSLISDNERFFASVAVSSRPPFWVCSETRKALPVPTPTALPTPTLLPVSTTKLSEYKANRVGEKFRQPFEDENGSEKVGRGEKRTLKAIGPCSLEVISETDCGSKTWSGAVTIERSASERKSEGFNGEALRHSKPGSQSQYFPSNFDKAGSQRRFHSSNFDHIIESKTAVPTVSREYETRYFQTKSFYNSESNPEEESDAFRKIYFPKRIRNGGTGIVSICNAQVLLPLGYEVPDEGQHFSNVCLNQDGGSLRSSTTSDWFSAKDGTTSSLCVDSINSDPINSDCDSEKGPETWLSKVKKVFGAVWAIIMPTATVEEPSSMEFDRLSDVDSGCSFGADQDLSCLQRSPSEMSELEKLAALANRIAEDRNFRRKESLEFPYDRQYPRSYYEATQVETSSNRAASPRGDPLGSISEEEEEVSYYKPNANHKAVSGSVHMIVNDRNTKFSLSDGNSDFHLTNINFADSNFELAHMSWPRSGNHFSNTPFINMSKVYNGCGEILRLGETAAENCKDFKTEGAGQIKKSTKIPAYVSPKNEETFQSNHASTDSHEALKMVPLFDGNHNGTSRCSENIATRSIPNRDEIQRGAVNCRNPNRSKIDHQSSFANAYPCKTRPLCRVIEPNKEADEHGKVSEQEENAKLLSEELKSFMEAKVLRHPSDVNGLIQTSKEEVFGDLLSTSKSIEATKSNYSKEHEDSLPYKQSQILANFSVSYELEKAIEMLAGSIREIQPDLSGEEIPSILQPAAEIDIKTEIENISQDRNWKKKEIATCRNNSPTRNFTLNTVDIVKNDDNAKEGSVTCTENLDCSLENSEIRLVKDSDLRITIYPAKALTVAERSSDHIKIKSLGKTLLNNEANGSRECLQSGKRTLQIDYQTTRENVGSFHPRGRKTACSFSGFDKELQRNSLVEKIQNDRKSELSSSRLGLASGATMNQFTATKSGNQSEFVSLQRASTLDRVRDGLPSPTVQRTRASKMAFLTGRVIT